MTKIFYIWHELTKQLIDPYEAQESPAEPGEFIRPICSTDKVPLPTPAGQYNYWNDEDWELRVDTRGIWYKPDRELVFIESLLDEIDASWSREVPPFTFAELQEMKREQIRISYEAACLEPVAALDLVWNGGFESAIKLDAAKRLSEAAGALGVRFFDIENHGHDLGFADALLVVIAVAGDFQTKLATKQGLMLAIDNASEETLEEITW